MKMVLKNGLISLTAVMVGVGGFYLYTKAATSDTVTATITIPTTISIADDGVNLSIASLTPSVINTSQTNTLTVASNVAAGFHVTVGLADLAAVAGQLCADSAGPLGTCDPSGFLFDGDGTASYLSVTSNAGVGSLASLASAAFAGSETKLGGSPVQVFTAAAPTNSTTFRVDYDAFADYSIAPDSYKGIITFTIVSGT